MCVSMWAWEWMEGGRRCGILYMYPLLTCYISVSLIVFFNLYGLIYPVNRFDLTLFGVFVIIIDIIYLWPRRFSF